jgi:DNA-binding PadR family transcriptional regulator
MAAAAAWGADDFPFDISECVSDLIGQLRKDLGSLADSWGGGQSGQGERGFGGRKGRGHWGGGFGSWGGWWPGMPGGAGFGGSGFGGPGQRPGQGPGPGFARPSGGGRGSKASRGDVRAAILALLREGPRNGYQIMADIEERSGGAWRPSPGAVYPALSALADEGLIVGEESEGKRTFHLTDAGREYVEQNPEMARGAWESAEQQEAWEVPGLFAEAARLGAGIVQVAHAGDHAQVQAAEKLLQRTRRELYRLLAEDEPADGEPEDNA